MKRTRLALSCTTERRNEMAKNYWCVTYLETDADGHTSFGNVGSMIYDCYGDALNALENDVREYLLGFSMSKDYKVDHVEGTNHWEFIHANNTKMEWEIQMMNNSLEMNEIEEEKPKMKKKFEVHYSFYLSESEEVEAETEEEARDIVEQMLDNGELGNLNEMDVMDRKVWVD